MKSTIFKELRLIALFALISGVQTMLMCIGCTVWRSYIVIYVFTLLMWILLWRGNHLITHFISSRISWLQYPVKRFFIGLTATILYTLFSVVAVIALVQLIFDFNFGSSYRFTIFFSILFTCVISLFLHTREFLQHWRRTALDGEKYKREKLSAQYESLKSRVNPQLLFNSLETLKGLVPQDKEEAVKFIKNLSDVYRYILDTRNKELAPQEDELKFLASFLDLLKGRYKDSLHVHVNLPEDRFYLMPLSVQIILEAIIENSRFSKFNPLQIEITGSPESIIIHAANVLTSEESRSALQEIFNNIKERYSFLVSSTVDYKMESGDTTVVLPLIRMT